MNAAFPPIPPDTESGAMVLPDEPTNNPLLKSDVIIVLPDPLGVRVRSLFAVVEITGLAPANVNAVDVKVFELIVPVTKRLLSTSTSPPENSNWSEVL